ncbi:MAG TPA: PEP-CTERM sorting domain-containing protein [Phycisphaerales bacterium]|nr:PEP-CTERM sorting domain-containing protein [Phycisphaerales bacterium]
MKTSFNRVALAALVAGVAGSAASADVVRDLGGGWQVIIADEIADQIDIVADGFVTVDGVRTLVIEKFAEFRSFDPLTGLFGGLPVQFRQVGADADTATRIIITDEALYNNTSQAWTGFRMQLIDSGQAGFDPAATFASGFSIGPFTTTTYSAGNTQVDFGGGVVPAGGIWYPGLGSGGLVINVNLSNQNPVVFTLKETPVPTPGAAALIGLGGLALSRRRR